MIGKAQRTEIFLSRLEAAVPCSSASEALELLAETLAAVEDEFTIIPNNPHLWESDGRLYPPREDSRREVEGHDDIVRYRSRKHSTLIASNGAIKIVKGFETCLDKPGSDGLTISEKMDVDTSRDLSKALR
ncbi:hypothetical protein [Bosea massiliensis]|uniref:Uncharacterized protein n=1 Tax=Bosea massiliensis TaxID=151419 RepID=A0ABW0P818_9HYPH